MSNGRKQLPGDVEQFLPDTLCICEVILSDDFYRRYYTNGLACVTNEHSSELWPYRKPLRIAEELELVSFGGVCLAFSVIHRGRVSQAIRGAAIRKPMAIVRPARVCA